MRYDSFSSPSKFELMEYLKLAFPIRRATLEKDDKLFPLIEKWDDHFQVGYNNLLKDTKEFFFTEEEKKYRCNAIAMTNTFNALAESFNLKDEIV